MKKLLLLFLVLCLLPALSCAETDHFKFANISLNGQSLSSLKSALEEATVLSFRIENGQLSTDLEPPITFMGFPIYTIYASASPLSSAQLSVCLIPYEIDGYNTGAIQSFDSGFYAMFREKAGQRFGNSSRMCVSFYVGDFNDLDSFDNGASYSFSEDELPFILNDACAYMFRNAYSGAYIEIYRKNTNESYIITNATDQELYGNVNVAFVVPSFTYYADDIESLIDDDVYALFPSFPMLNGKMQYTKDF